MKRIVKGITYDTDTSTMVARRRNHYPAVAGRAAETVVRVLYQARSGTFFIHHAMQAERHTSSGRLEPVERHEFEAIGREEASAWVASGDVELLSPGALGEPATPAGEPETLTTFYIRVPLSLRTRAEKIAARQELSLNAWATGCIERGVEHEETTDEVK
jgi:hypothetical protein